MARSGNVNGAEELARKLGMHYAFVPNYFELTLGNRMERRATRACQNSAGFIGNAILSRWEFRRVRRAPLPLKFDWYRHYEKRVGTRVAVVAEIEGPHGPIAAVAAHLEAMTGPEARAEQMRVLLGAIPSTPSETVIGGDFNTFGLRPSWLGALQLFGRRLSGRNPSATSIAKVEPLFEETRRAGFSWEGANGSATTWRYPPVGPLLQAKLDWAFVRGLAVDPESISVVPPVANGRKRSRRLSDHDGLTLAVRAR
jgi:endonuclease/exonuclease/phosphatase family metal-dependent hydrolase